MPNITTKNDVDGADSAKGEQNKRSNVGKVYMRDEFKFAFVLRNIQHFSNCRRGLAESSSPGGVAPPKALGAAPGAGAIGPIKFSIH